MRTETSVSVRGAREEGLERARGLRWSSPGTAEPRGHAGRRPSTHTAPEPDPLTAPAASLRLPETLPAGWGRAAERNILTIWPRLLDSNTSFQKNCKGCKKKKKKVKDVKSIIQFEMWMPDSKGVQVS